MSRPGAPLIGELEKRKTPALDWAGWTHLLSQGLSQCSQTAAEGRTDRAERQDRHCGLRPRPAGACTSTRAPTQRSREEDSKCADR